MAAIQVTDTALLRAKMTPEERAEFDRLADQMENLGEVTVDHVTAGNGVGLEDQRLNHHRHTVVISLRL